MFYSTTDEFENDFEYPIDQDEYSTSNLIDYSQTMDFVFEEEYPAEEFWGPLDVFIYFRKALICVSILISVSMIFGLISLSNFQIEFTATGHGGAVKSEVPIAIHENQQNSTSNDCIVSEGFPAKVLQWCQLITTYAQHNNLPPDLLAALIWQESGGDSKAYSRSGAVGLMQVMPSDGPSASFMCVNGPCFSDRPTTDQLMDPEFNIKYGTKLLARLLARNGDLREALKSYGPMDVGYYYADKVIGLFQKYGMNQ